MPEPAQPGGGPIRPRGAGILLFGLLLWAPVAAAARDCGGGRPCGCGDRVVADVRLDADLGPCPKDGLRLARKVRVDGAGHVIQGGGGRAGRAGVRIGAEASGSEVRDLEVTGFGRGVRLVGARGVRLLRVEAHHNGDRSKGEGYGIDVARGASENVLEEVRVHHNADEGIHVGSGSDRNRLVGVQAYANERENVYFLSNRGNRLEGSTLRASGAGHAAVYVKNTSDLTLTRNRIEDGPVHIRGLSRDVRLVENDLSGGGVVVQPYDGARPARVEVRGGTIEGPSVCVRVDAGEDVVLRGVGLACATEVAVAGGSRVVVVSDRDLRARCRGPGEVVRMRPLEMRFLDEQGRPLPGVTVEASGTARLGPSDAAGRVRGEIEAARMSCPEGRWRPREEVRVSVGDWSRSLALDALVGDVSLGPR